MSENKPLHRFYYIFVQSKIRKERSDFAAWQTITPKCRGRRPRRPTTSTFRHIIFHNTTELHNVFVGANSVRPFRSAVQFQISQNFSHKKRAVKNRPFKIISNLSENIRVKARIIPHSSLLTPHYFASSFFILSIASTVLSLSPKAVSLNQPSPFLPKPAPGVPTTFAFSRR